MTRFIPIILASVIFFACNTDSQKQAEEKSIPPSEIVEKEAVNHQPAVVAIAQQESKMEEQKEEVMEEAPMEEKVNVKPIVQEKTATEKSVAKPMDKKAEQATIKKEVQVHEEETKRVSSKKEEVPTKEVVESTDKKIVKPEIKVDTPKEEIPKKIIPTHENWDQLVRKYISSTGKVNYKGFKADKAKLEAYLQELANNQPESNWKRNEAMAYWINAYNANTIKLIVDNYPVKSIMDLHSGKAFDRKWIKIGDKTYSLNNIENDILRPRYKDARIHFAVNCAAKSCPPIHNRAWTASNLSSTLQAKAKAFVNNTQYNTIEKGSVEISKIFEWYAGDFGNIITYLNKYATTEIKDNAKVSYKEYDWALNQ